MVLECCNVNSTRWSHLGIFEQCILPVLQVALHKNHQVNYKYVRTLDLWRISILQYLIYLFIYYGKDSNYTLIGNLKQMIEKNIKCKMLKNYVYGFYIACLCIWQNYRQSTLKMAHLSVYYVYFQLHLQSLFMWWVHDWLTMAWFSWKWTSPIPTSVSFSKFFQNACLLWCNSDPARCSWTDGGECFPLQG